MSEYSDVSSHRLKKLIFRGNENSLLPGVTFPFIFTKWMSAEPSGYMDRMLKVRGRLIFKEDREAPSSNMWHCIS
jgi:hypothetical protein